MKSYVYVLATLMEDRILTKCYSQLAIHLEKESCALLVLELGEQLSQPDALTSRYTPPRTMTTRQFSASGNAMSPDRT
jgi:hypothetical protein